MVAWCAHDALNHLYDARALEQMHLLRIFLKDLREGKTLHGSLSFIIRVCRRLYRDMRWVALIAFLDGEEAGICSVGGAQAQKDIEERTRGARRGVHGEGMYVCVRESLLRRMQAQS